MINRVIRRLEASIELSGPGRRALAQLCTNVRELSPREYLVRQGDRPSTVPLMMEGWAARYTMLEDGRRQITSFMIPGDIGDRRQFAMRDADHSIVALKACTIAYVPSHELESLIAEYPDIARAFAWSSLLDEAALRSWVVNVGRRVSFERIAHLMCEMHARIDLVGLAEPDGEGGSSFSFPLTQEDLADTAGLTPVHTNRILQRLRSENLISFQSRRLRILDVDELRAVAGFEPGYLHLLSDEKAVPPRLYAV